MFKSAATKIAHNSTLPALAINQDLRPLQDLITAEKAVILSLQRLATDLSKASEALKSWGLGEGDDLGDILTASTTILTHFTSALSQYAAHGHSMREQLKFIRTREESLDELKRRRRNVNSKADTAEKKLNKMNMENKNFVSQTELLNKLRDEIRSLDFEIMKDEAAIADFKRSSTRMWVGLKFGGLIECCEKGVIAGEYGKLIVSEIPEDQSQPGLPRPPYLAHSRIGDLVAEAHRCVNEVRLSTVPSNTLPPQQQLPQVPHVSDSPFTSQGGYSPAPYPTQHRMTESYSDDPSKRNLVDLQSPTIPLGRFDSPVEQSPQQHQYSNSLSNAILPSSLSGGRRVDEFGSPIVEPGGGGGRFATFPVKARSGSTSAAEGAGAPYSLLATPPPDRGQSDSFSSSVAQALAATTTTTTTTNEQIPPSKIGRFANEPAPSYEASVDLEQSKPSSGSQQSGGGGVEETNLAYMTEREESQHASRHVHFGAADTVPQQEDPLGTPSRQGQQARLARLLQNEDEEQDNSGNMRNEQLMDADAAREVALELNSPFDDSQQQQQQQPAPQTTAAAARASSPSPSSPSSSGGGGVVNTTDLERAPTYTEKPISYHNQYGAPVGGAGSSSVSPPQYPQYPLSPPSSSPQQQQQPSYTYESHDRGYPRTPYPHQQVPGVMSAEATTPVHLYQPAGMQQSVYPAGGGGGGGYGLREEQEQDFYNPYSEHQDVGNTGGGGGGGTPPSMLLSNPPSSSPLPNVPQIQTQSQSQSSPVHGLPSGAYPPYNQPLRQQSPPPPVSPSVSISSPLGENNNGGKPRSPLYERPPNAPYMNKPDSGNRSTSSLGSLTPGGVGIGGGGGGGKISAAAFKRPSPRLGANTSMSAAGMNSTPFSNNTVSPTSGQDTPPLRISKPRTSQQQQQQDLGEGQYDYIGAYLNEGEGGEEVGEGGERERGAGRGNVNVNVGAGVGTYYYDGYGGGGGGGGQGKFTENK
ncbi:hypothetical protein Agabi119p4_10763 [Agaricus bisporus var. burnettii]|uniref:Eisosome component PIL1-domain-containing protein n=1 Tax=Agaricus bisporus var. burnettii TaxID=192524 RepID=A0A8H7C0A7_AGABI|nr:hypothetical protein Agabi119p4_10763 [Agaricus bisporus var. burnettii]